MVFSTDKARLRDFNYYKPSYFFSILKNKMQILSKLSNQPGSSGNKTCLWITYDMWGTCMYNIIHNASYHFSGETCCWPQTPSPLPHIGGSPRVKKRERVRKIRPRRLLRENYIKGIIARAKRQKNTTCIIKVINICLALCFEIMAVC